MESAWKRIEPHHQYLLFVNATSAPGILSAIPEKALTKFLLHGYTQSWSVFQIRQDNCPASRTADSAVSFEHAFSQGSAFVFDCLQTHHGIGEHTSPARNRWVYCQQQVLLISQDGKAGKSFTLRKARNAWHVSLFEMKTTSFGKYLKPASFSRALKNPSLLPAAS